MIFNYGFKFQLQQGLTTLKKTEKKHGGARRGAGRKPKFAGPVQVVSVKMLKTTARELANEAKQAEISRNELIVSIIEKRPRSQ